MGLYQMLSVITLVTFTAVSPAQSDTPPPSEPSQTWECPQSDGTSVYTNKEKPGCRPMTLKSLSVVPSLDNMPLIPRSIGNPPYQAPVSQGYGPVSGAQNLSLIHISEPTRPY